MKPRRITHSFGKSVHWCFVHCCPVLLFVCVGFLTVISIRCAYFVGLELICIMWVIGNEIHRWEMKIQVVKTNFQVGMLLCFDPLLCLNPRFFMLKVENNFCWCHCLGSECVCLKFKSKKFYCNKLEALGLLQQFFLVFLPFGLLKWWFLMSSRLSFVASVMYDLFQKTSSSGLVL